MPDTHISHLPLYKENKKDDQPTFWTPAPARGKKRGWAKYKKKAFKVEYIATEGDGARNDLSPLASDRIQYLLVRMLRGLLPRRRRRRMRAPRRRSKPWARNFYFDLQASRSQMEIYEVLLHAWNSLASGLSN